ncbi:MAG: heparin lyase I family protein [Bacteroidota bacterium]
MKLFGYIALALGLSLGCTQKRIENWPPFLADDFESISRVDELTEGEEAIWKYYQQAGEQNTISIDRSNPHTGLQCLKFTAEPSIDGASKSDIAHNRLLFQAGEKVLFNGWYYIEGTANLDYVFLMDLEQDIAIGAGPGIRIALEDSIGYLVLERNKFLETTLRQETAIKVAFPRDEWVEIRMEVLLGQKEKGAVKIWQNGQLLIDVENTPTLARDRLTVLQGTHNYYHNLQVGITANSPSNPCLMYIDDISIEVIP